MATADSDLLEIELEALTATYGDELSVTNLQQQSPTQQQEVLQVGMAVLPQREHHALGEAAQPQHQQHQQHFVQCSLLLSCVDYPSQPPSIQLQDVKGFAAREQQLLQQLSAEAAELAGEMLLGHLIEAARCWLTEHNHPEGPCIFCLEDLAAAAAAAASDAAGEQLMRLPCFHAFHQACFASWWCWQQQAYSQQQAALEEKTGATAAAALAQEALPPKDGPHHFQLACPTCRAPFQLRDLLQPFQQQLQKQLSLQQVAGGSPPAAPSSSQEQQQQQQSSSAATKLTDAQLQPFRELQQRHARLFAQQQRRQGIIDTEASYSINDWVPVVQQGAGGAAADGSGGSGGGRSATAGRSSRGRGRTGRHAGSSSGHSGRSSNQAPPPQQRERGAPPQVEQRPRGGGGGGGRSGSRGSGRGAGGGGRGGRSGGSGGAPAVVVGPQQRA